MNNKRVLDDTVVVHNSLPEDSAVYQCQASNRHGSILANANIMVMSEYHTIKHYLVLLGGCVWSLCVFINIRLLL